MTTPIGVMMFSGYIVRRFCGLISGKNLMKIPMTIDITAITPHVSILFRPFSPSLNRSVIMSQNIIPKRIGGIPGAISCERDCPSPIR